MSITTLLAEHQDVKIAGHTVIVPPDRIDRSPCGTGTSARLAVLHVRGQLGIAETFIHKSLIGSSFIGSIRGTCEVGHYSAILPAVKGRAWITGYKQVLLDPTDLYLEGFTLYGY